MTNPLNFPDFEGLPHVEPSLTARMRAVEAARFVGENPFVPTLLAAFAAGAPDEVAEYTALSDFLDAHDPERVGGTPAICGTFAFRPSRDATVRGAPRLRCVRVGADAQKPLQATLGLNDPTPADVITLTARDYGTYTNRLRAKVEAESGAHTGTAQGGAAAAITLAATASAVDDAYLGYYVAITAGTGIGQVRKITDYVGATRAASVAAWTVQPDNTSVYVVYRGLKVKVGYKDTPAFVKSGDHLGPLFTLQFTLAADTATVTVTADVAGTATRLQTALANGAAGTAALDLDLTSPEFDTVQKVVNFINRQPGYKATPIASDLDLTACPSKQIDAVVAASILAGGAMIEARIGAIVEWINANVLRLGPVPGATAARNGNVTAAPAPMAAWADFAGGAAPAVTSTDYDAALDVLDREEVPAGILFLDTADATVRDLVLAWIDEQAAKGRMWRASFAVAAGTSDEAALIAAGNIGRTRVALWHQRTVDTLDSTVTHAPIVAAAAFAGLTGGINAANDVQTAVLTERPLRVASILKADRRSLDQRAALLSGGVNVLRQEQPGGRVLISMAVSTDQGPKRTWRMWSESVVIDLIAWSLLQALEPLKVAWGTQQYLASVRSAYQTIMGGWANPDNPVISAGTDPETGENVPAFSPATITISNGKTTLAFECGLVGETDHLAIDGVVRKVNLSLTA